MLKFEDSNYPHITLAQWSVVPNPFLNRSNTLNLSSDSSVRLLNPRTCLSVSNEKKKSKAPVNAEVNSGNRKAVLASNYATRICGRHAALGECIMYKK